MKPVYREMRIEDIRTILDISSLQLGPSYLNESEIIEFLNNRNTHIVVLLVEERIIGYSIIHLVEKALLHEYINSRYLGLLERFDPKTRIQLRKTTAIHPEFTRRGLGTEFIRHTMNLYRDECDLIMSINWKRKKDIPMAVISVNLGMKQFAELKNYWKEESLKSNYYCPECGKPPCKCSAVLYIKKSEE